ncbi:hypothetical protein ACFSND_33015 [Brevibacillus brevis]|uniref:hypothetical protein n=1 Tax=Brevibacillus brevis TaxID=1393 RepID=UPI0036410D11
MSTFKDQLKADATVFLNTGEFADEIDIDGKKITGLIEPVAIGGGNRSYSYPTHDREYTEEIMLYVSRADFHIHSSSWTHVKNKQKSVCECSSTC